LKKQITYFLSGILIASMLIVTIQANTLPFVPFEPSDKLTGDVNGDGRVGSDDSTLLNQYFAGCPVSINHTLADVDGDRTVTRRDAMILARYFAGWDGYTLSNKVTQ